VHVGLHCDQEACKQSRRARRAETANTALSERSWKVGNLVLVFHFPTAAKPSSTQANASSHNDMFFRAQKVFRRKWEKQLQAERYTRHLGWHSIFNFPTGWEPVSCYMFGPPIARAGSAMFQQRAKRELGPRLLRNHHEEEITAGFEHPGSFCYRLVAPGAVHMIHGVGAHHAIEFGGFEWKLPHVRRHNRGASVNSRGFQICEQSLLRRSLTAKVLRKRFGKSVRRNQRYLGASLKNHDGRSSCTCAYIKHAAPARSQELLRRQHRRTIHVDYEPIDKKRRGRPTSDEPDKNLRQDPPFSYVPKGEHQSCAGEDRQVTIA